MPERSTMSRLALWRVGRGQTHAIQELKPSPTRDADQPNGVTFCGKVVNPCTTTADFRGFLDTTTDLFWLTCKRCNADVVEEGGLGEPCEPMDTLR